MGAVRDIGSAVRLLTVVPVPGTEGENVVPYLSWVGWLFTGVGVAAASGAFATGRSTGLAALLVGALTVFAWALLSGFMHWDGLADTVDGLGVRGDAERRLAVMRDSAVGAFGVVAVVLVALVQVVALSVVVESGVWWALGAPVLGRAVAALTLQSSVPARDDGLGARYVRRGGTVGMVVALLPLAPLILSVDRAAATLACLAAGSLLARGIVRRIGGVTGDVAGAVVVLTESMVLVVGALAGGGL